MKREKSANEKTPKCWQYKFEQTIESKQIYSYQGDALHVPTALYFIDKKVDKVLEKKRWNASFHLNRVLWNDINCVLVTYYYNQLIASIQIELI